MVRQGRVLRVLALAATAALLTGCETERDAPAPTLAAQLEAVAQEASVPADLLLAIGVVEGGLGLAAWRVPAPDDHVPVAGLLELRHGRLDTLAWGARLVGVSEPALRRDTALGTRAGALVLAQLGRVTGAEIDDMRSWRAAVAALSGLGDDDAAAYADQVFALLRAGGRFVAADGERVVVAAHPQLPAAPGVTARVRAADTPDFGGATWFATDCTDKCTPGRPDGVTVDTIVIHDTEGGWSASVATLQFDPGKSVHYIVDADGSRVGQFLHERDTAFHAGNLYYNQRSVGIEHVGFVGTPYDARLYATSRALVRSIRTRHDVPLDRAHIIGHYQVPNGHMLAESDPPCADALAACEADVRYGGVSHHTDPGLTWQWCQYLAALGGSCACADANPTWTCTTDGTQAVRCVGGEVALATCTGGCSHRSGATDDCRGATPSPDAGPEPDAALAPANGGDEGDGGGCSCQVGRARRWPPARGDGAAFAGLALVCLLARRRRRR
jgi:N-acetyl-anhydromuramyl-L-alanine amidase AmpD